jgi:hypothetical protein
MISPNRFRTLAHFAARQDNGLRLRFPAPFDKLRVKGELKGEGELNDPSS